MTAMTDVLIPTLEDAREAHAAVVDRFLADVTMTPPGAQRQRLERQVTAAQEQLERIEERLRKMRSPRGLPSAAAHLMRIGIRSAVRAPMLPLEVAVELARGQNRASEYRLLKNTEDEYAAAARALATCQAGKDIAEQLHDQETADLLAALRRQDEQLLETLEENLAQQARAVATAANGHRPAPAETDEERSLLDNVVRTARLAAIQLRTALRWSTRRVRDTAEGAWREIPGPTRMAREVQGAVTREQHLPIPEFGRLDITEIQQRLCGLSQTELTVIEGYERAHGTRPGVLNAINRLREAEPWVGYDAMAPERIKIHLHDVTDNLVRRVLEYERRHRQRNTVINAAEAVLQTAPEATHRAEEEAQGKVSREEDLPIRDYSRLSTTEIEQHLRGLSRPDLAVIQGYERTHACRQVILDAIEQLCGPGEPWTGYDAMDPDVIVSRLDRVPVSLARQVMEYERRHQQRQRIISAAQIRIPM
ncbi:hypothetical protein [Streptomyces gibsoniae]|uniref:DUF222 domain-containing protein n=1 Tax=Streptomyces gibsoniae TaxID=3075529 RepID=A0ABU2U6D1_9ACTN|nr:hypothetical protein [Streptomyces sp. DSM 41699]MDT0468787.1 hypothetical protein [Streptomyces sp. DSM 41699]